MRVEPDPWVRAVLGHFLFVFIHPYSGGYHWAIIRVESRADYMAALERASVDGDIAPFTAFVAREMAASAVLPASFRP